MTAQRYRTPAMRAFHEAPQAASRLVCFPHAGGFASYFFPLSRALAPAVEVLGVQYPGRLDRSEEPAVEDIGVLAEEAAALIADDPHPPPTLFGHSMGALVAFETAKRLTRDHGITPAGLIVSGMRAPSRPRRRPRDWDREEELLDEMRLLSGTDPALMEDEELRELFLPVLRSDFRAVNAYPGDDTVLSCPVTAFAGDEDPVTPDGVHHWATHTSAEFTTRSFPGDHFYLKGFPPSVTAAVREALSRS
ncbi:alpha/beta fold hydrolase [Streptomyces sp. NPDC048442]|uniref:thioesterase II family protein n=1 Tax=Streptomyces sp. NPDC048442 TaxID=3154823 RepID=UPI00343D4AA3